MHIHITTTIICQYICITCIHVCIYIYIYYREREREREQNKKLACPREIHGRLKTIM